MRTKCKFVSFYCVFPVLILTVSLLSVPVLPELTSFVLLFLFIILYSSVFLCSLSGLPFKAFELCFPFAGFRSEL
jgi:hypothetical protein